MSHPSKRKGYQFEVEIVEAFKAAGIKARRAWGSNGQSIGLPATVDVEAGGCKAQLKRRHSIPKVFSIPEGADVTIFREDRGESFVLVKLADFVRMLGNAWPNAHAGG